MIFSVEPDLVGSGEDWALYSVGAQGEKPEKCRSLFYLATFGNHYKIFKTRPGAEKWLHRLHRWGLKAEQI